MLNDNVKKVLKEISAGNNRGEKITLVAATKMQSAETINAAIASGVTVVAENKVQEFREKTALLSPCRQHFIGHLQTNKVKYLVGKVELIHSVDTLNLATAINDFAAKKGIVQDILIEVNVGGEETKSGFAFTDAESAVFKIANTLKNVRVTGLMAMMPISSDNGYLASLFDKMRALFDKLKNQGLPFTYLSMGMSEDYKIAIAHGSNTIRLGTALFGKRNYGENN
ncbi:MAG: YggS family pyridoxal phosphate-dependent enzyme [Clostridia bacterium]|nr:YggS family pyridoxal phosphate-dependent enzyme [Clostridia bacterium]